MERKPEGQNRKNKPTALSGNRFDRITNETTKADTGSRRNPKAAHHGATLDEIVQESAEVIVVPKRWDEGPNTEEGNKQQ